MLNRLKRASTRREEKGAVAILVALSFTVFIILVALVIDLGMARDTRRVSQNAADASALAAANTLYPELACPTGGAKPCVSDAVAAVKSYAASNFDITAAEWTACTATMPSGYVAMGGTSCIAFNSATAPTKVWVRIPTRNVKTNFAGIIGKSNVAVGSQAEAEIGTEINCSLCFLGNIQAQNADFNVIGGSIAVNGNVNAGPNSFWNSNSNGVVGTVNGGVFSPAATTISPFGDPLAALSLPLSDATHTVKTNPCTQGPGIYNTDISLGNNVVCNLTPGLYVINREWGIGNNTLVTCVTCIGNLGVTIYVPGPNGYLDWKNGNTLLKAPTTGPWKDLAVVYSRDNTNPFSIQGNGAMGITGTVYLKSGALDFNGNSEFNFTGGPIVAAGVIMANGNTSGIRITNPTEVTVTRTDLHLSQ